MKQNKLTITFFSLLVALAFTACNDDLLEKHPLDEVSSADFFKQPSDMEIYVDNLAAMQIHNMNKYIEYTRAKLQEKGTNTSDHVMETLEAATIKEDDYFANLLGNDITGIAKDIKEAHKKDSNTGSDTTEVDEIEDAFEQVQKADNATQAQMIMYSKMFKINFSKTDPHEFKTFTDILQRYSDAFKVPKGNGRGKRK